MRRRRAVFLDLLCACGHAVTAAFPGGKVKRKVKCPSCGVTMKTSEASNRVKHHEFKFSYKSVRESWRSYTYDIPTHAMRERFE